ncbi:MAG: hypothetical protein WCG78_06530 [Candidatus Omnitrophota bacterium]
MRRVAVILIMSLALAAPAHAVNVVDALVCKKVHLRANEMSILVNRVTGEVKYLQRTNGQWILLEGERKNEYQAMYDAQVENFPTGLSSKQ